MSSDQSEAIELPGQHETTSADLGVVLAGMRPQEWATVAVLGCVALIGVIVVVPASVLAPWVVLVCVGVPLAVLDIRTQTLPTRLVRPAWAVMGAAVLSLPLTSSLTAMGRAAAGAAICGGVFALLWLLSRGQLGFGDVRFSLLTGAAAGALSWQAILIAPVLGSIAGALWAAVVLILRGRRESFPYAPALLVGCLLAPAVAGSLGG